MGYIYCLFDIKNNITRVGKTKTKDKSRQKQQLGYYPFTLLEWTFKVNNYGDVETDIHRQFKKHKCNGDWYSLNITKVLEYIMNNHIWEELDSPSPSKVLSVMVNNT
ncbi:GIY-YIG nuclease family protein [Joostella sp.]|uniref:GIY-YIG nuclease family protein n=1 Tax=Joostella sp. TaxID=2231138 RepID=UPI003A9050D8